MRVAICLHTAIRLSESRATPPEGLSLVAPGLLRSQMVDHYYRIARQGGITDPQARAHMDHMRKLKIRLLGDRVLQATAWAIAEKLGLPDTYAAEYIAAARLQADVFVTLDDELASSLDGIVTVKPYAELFEA